MRTSRKWRRWRIQHHVYVLRLDADKWYVGQTTDLRSRLRNHWEQAGFGARWTEQYRPLSLAWVKEVDSRADALHLEKMKALELASLRGHENVRGSYWCGKFGPTAYGPKTKPREVKPKPVIDEALTQRIRQSALDALARYRGQE